MITNSLDSIIANKVDGKFYILSDTPTEESIQCLTNGQVYINVITLQSLGQEAWTDTSEKITELAGAAPHGTQVSSKLST